MSKYVQSAPQVLPAGMYSFTVKNAREKLSANGNEMIELQLSIEGSSVVVYDNLVFTPKSTWKIDNFRCATGEVLTPGLQVDFTAMDCLGKSGKVQLVMEDFDGRSRNKVSQYIVPSSTTSNDGALPPPAASKAPAPRRSAQPEEGASPEEDGIPF